MLADVEAADGAVASGRVHPWGEGERRSVVGTSELHLGQVVDEEVELGGYAAQTGLDQPDRVGERSEVITHWLTLALHVCVGVCVPGEVHGGV